MTRRLFIGVQFFTATFLLAMALMAGPASAGKFLNSNTTTNMNNGTQGLANTAGYETSTADSALTLVQTVINIFLSVIGVLLLAYILFAGYNWLTAEGEEEKVQKAKDTIKRAIVGVIIIVAAYAISVFVMSRIEAGTLKSVSDSGQLNVYQS
ncbi:MAG: pilin [Patescibacteria group bacterium]|nr:pilin [Patescibacteria group bacterium]